MTLRLVSENTTPIIATNFAARCRQLADEIEAGEYGDVCRIGMVIEYDGGLIIEGWGERVGCLDLMGLFEAAKLHQFADSLPGD